MITTTCILKLPILSSRFHQIQRTCNQPLLMIRILPLTKMNSRTIIMQHLLMTMVSVLYETKLFLPSIRAWWQPSYYLDGPGRIVVVAAWQRHIASYVVLFLGFYINSRTMMVTWPLYKRQDLYTDIQSVLASPRKVTPGMTASIIGKVRSAGKIALWGPYISFSVADTLKNATHQSFSPV